MNIGKPKRVFEIEPITLPIPQVLPEPEQVPERVPAEPSQPGETTD
ncbi:MAG: hypothetical protein AB1551_05760 [Actinomycetota bacterium]